MTRSQMLRNRRRKQQAKKLLAGVAKRAKKLSKQHSKAARAASPSEVLP